MCVECGLNYVEYIMKIVSKVVNLIASRALNISLNWFLKETD